MFRGHRGLDGCRLFFCEEEEKKLSNDRELSNQKALCLLLVGAWGKSFTTFCSTAFNDVFATSRRHSFSESVVSGSFYITWLERSFHSLVLLWYSVFPEISKG